MSLDCDVGDGNEGDGNEGDGDDGDGIDGDGIDGDGNDVGEGRVGGEGTEVGEGRVGGEGTEVGEGRDGIGVDCGELVLGIGLGIPGGDGNATLQPVNTKPNTTARTPIADCRLAAFNDQRERRLIAISRKP